MKRSSFALSLLSVGILTSGTACSTRADSDEIYLYYKSGAGENREFIECIEPGTGGKYPIDDEVYSLPTSLRTWNIRPDGGDTNVPIKSGSLPVSGPGPEVDVWTTLDFYLNTDCSDKKNSPVVKFWENTGKRSWKDGKGVSTVDGFQEDVWRVMLLNTLVPAQEKSIREETRKYTADDLDANTNGVYNKIEQQLGINFLNHLRAKVGGDYFCGTGYRRGEEVEWKEWVPDGTDEKGGIKVREETKKGKCPPVRISIIDINFSDKTIGEARARVFAAKSNAEAELIKARAELEKSNILGQASANESYLKIKKIEADLEAAKACASNPNCTIIQVQGNNGVNVNTK